MVNLHNHTQFSPLDGMVRVEELVERAATLNHPAVAITDHGDCAGHLSLLRCASDVKPIFGCEFYFCDDRRERPKDEKRRHLILLAKDKMGLKNLYRLSSESFLTGFYVKPRIDWELLEKYNEGLLATTACLQGMLSILGNLSEEEVLSRLMEHFDGRLWLEMIPFNTSEQQEMNKRILKLAKKYKLPTIVSSDSHYIEKKDFRFHDLLLAVQTKKRLDDPNRFRYATDDFYFHDEGDFIRELHYLPKKDVVKAIEETEHVAEMVEDLRVGFPFPSPLVFSPADEEFDAWKKGREGKENELYFRFLTEKGIREKLVGKPYFDQSYIDRINHEIATIRENGFVDYFLVVAEYVNYAKSNGIEVGPARGSSAGSIIAYLLGITEVDPLKYDLYFERFLAPGRKKLPDIDVDFDHRYRQKIIDHIMEIYGKNNVCQVGTYIKMDKRTTIRDVARAMGASPSDCDALVETILAEVPEELSFAEWGNPEEIERLCGNVFSGEKRKFFAAAVHKLEGTIRQYGRHAAGIVIAGEPLASSIPLRSISGNKVTQNDMGDLESIGLVKFDILGVKALSVIKRTKELLGEEVDIDLEDPRVWEMIAEGDCVGLFQLETAGLTNLVRRLKPMNIQQLAIALALYRPGPLRSGLADRYVSLVAGEFSGSSPLLELEKIIPETNGIMIFQEQVLKVAQAIANYSPEESDRLREIIAKRKTEELANEEKLFRSRTSHLSAHDARRLWKEIVEYGGYAFNKSHAVSYALLAYRTAWYKYHYPRHYMCALLSIETANQDLYIEECHKLGIKILPPDVNRSQLDFSLSPDGEIVFGLLNVKGIGNASAEEIVEKSPFSSMEDFIKKVNARKVNRKIVETLILCGAFDSLCQTDNRRKIMEEYYKIRGTKDDVPEVDNKAEEIRLLGCSLSSPWDKVGGRKKDPQRAFAWKSLPPNYPVLVGGVVVQPKRTKGGGSRFIFSTRWGDYLDVICSRDLTDSAGEYVILKLKKSRGLLVFAE